MNLRTPTLIALTLGGMILSASGQGASRPGTPSGDQKKQISDAAEKLRQAQANGDLDKARDTAKGLMGNLPGSLTDAAKAALQSPEAKAQAAEAARAAAKSLLPEAQKMLDARKKATADSPPEGSGTPTAADQPPAATEGPKPQLLQPIADSPPETPANPGAAPERKAMVVIDADNSVFDPNTNILIYTGNVRARHPQFYIECEELIVHMEETSKETDGKPVLPKDDPLLAPPKKKSGKEEAPPIKKAIASGPMVRIEKKDPEGKVQRAFCRNAVYDGATGLITMRDNPQVQTDNIMQTSISPDTVMTFDKNGKFSSNRPTRTVILGQE